MRRRKIHSAAGGFWCSPLHKPASDLNYRIPASARSHSLQVGYRTLHAAAPAHFLHFTFNQLCMAATSVMDYLALCEQHESAGAGCSSAFASGRPGAQQRFINLVDVSMKKTVSADRGGCLRTGRTGGGCRTGRYSAYLQRLCSWGNIRGKAPRRSASQPEITDRNGRGSSLWSGPQQSP